MVKLKKGDLCKIWINEHSCYWAIYESFDNGYLHFSGIYDNFLLKHKKATVQSINITTQYKITVWKLSSFNRKITPFGVVVRNGAFIDSYILITELSELLANGLSIIACNKFISRLESIKNEIK